MIALIMTGFQNDFCDVAGSLASSGKDLSRVVSMLPFARTLLRTCRETGIPIVHVGQRSLANGLSDSESWSDQSQRNGWVEPLVQEGSWGEAPVAGFEPLKDELTVERFRAGSLSDTRTNVLLRSAGVSRLVIAGVETHQAVLTTVIQAVNMDYLVVVPSRCVASTDRELHDAALTILHSYADVVDGDISPSELRVTGFGEAES